MVAVGLMLAAAALAVQQPASTAPERLQPGDFVWMPEAAPAGPLLLIVSLAEQRAHLYRNGVRIAVTTVSTGRPGFETPPGVYQILQKHVEHYSNLYDAAPMPYMQRLTWTGVALHAGRLPGYPASHGCIRLPDEFARRLFGVTSLGMTVVVSGGAAEVPRLVHPGWLSPAIAEPAIHGDTPDRWTPEAAPEGPMTIVVSTTDREVRVLRNGVEIGRAMVELDGPPEPGIRILQLQGGTASGESAYVPGRPRLDWRQVVLEGSPPVDAASAGTSYGRLRVAPEFARRVYDELRPGTTVVITSDPLDRGPPGEPLIDVVIPSD